MKKQKRPYVRRAPEAVEAVEAVEESAPVAVVDDPSDDILAGSPEDQLIGQEPEPLNEQQQFQAAQTRAMQELAAAVKGIVDDQNRIRQVPYNQIKLDTPWHPSGDRNRPKFSRTTTQHGEPIKTMMISDEDILLCNQLKPGVYFADSLPPRGVVVRPGSDGSIDISWDNAKIEQRMAFNQRFGSFTGVLKAVIAERKLREERRRAGDIWDNEPL